ncbi:hypothetical protein ACOSQ3_028926 [Xanthoceras sorbifolium]
MIKDCSLEEEAAISDTQDDNSFSKLWLEISFHAMVVAEHPRTLRVKGTLKQKEVIILIDRGITHNFIYQSLVSTLALPTVRDGTFQEDVWPSLWLFKTIPSRLIFMCS